MRLIKSMVVGTMMLLLNFSSLSAVHSAVTPMGGPSSHTPTGSEANRTAGYNYGGFNYTQGRVEPHQYDLTQPYNEPFYGTRNWNNNQWDHRRYNNPNNWNNNYWYNDSSGYGSGYYGNSGYNAYSGNSGATFGTENMTPSEEALYQYNEPSNGYRGNPVFYNYSVGGNGFN